MRHSGDGEAGNLRSERKERGGCSAVGAELCPHAPRALPSLSSGAGGSAPPGLPRAGTGCGEQPLQEGMRAHRLGVWAL